MNVFRLIQAGTVCITPRPTPLLQQRTEKVEQAFYNTMPEGAFKPGFNIQQV